MRMHHRPMQFFVSTLVKESRMISEIRISIPPKLGEVGDSIWINRLYF